MARAEESKATHHTCELCGATLCAVILFLMFILNTVTTQHIYTTAEFLRGKLRKTI